MKMYNANLQSLAKFALLLITRLKIKKIRRRYEYDVCGPVLAQKSHVNTEDVEFTMRCIHIDTRVVFFHI